jgi:hypothetical protein
MRTQRLLRQALLAALGLSIAHAAAADSDGAFCIGNGDVAYELGSWNSASDRHVVYIVRVGGKAGIAKPASVGLDDFQVHGMRCEDDRLIVRGWDKRYVVGLDPPAVHAVEPAPPANLADAADIGDTGALELGHARRFPIPARGTPHRYELRIAYRDEPHLAPAQQPPLAPGVGGSGGIIYHFYVTSVVQLDRSGAIVRQREMYRGVREETID